MKKIISFILLLAFVGAFTPVNAFTVNVNTTIPIKLSKHATSKNTATGSTIDAYIAEDVLINNVIVFKQNDKATLNVIEAKKAGFVGIPGEMLIQGGQVYDVHGKAHRIDYSNKVTGEEKTWPKVMLGCGVFIILAPLALFGFVKGGQAELTTVQTLDVRLMNEFEF